MASTRKMTKTLLALFVLSPFILAGCDGYVAVPYYGSPYGGDRTAGSGVAYVKAKLMKERGPVLRAEQSVNKAIVEPIKDIAPVIAAHVEAAPADKVFNSLQKK